MDGTTKMVLDRGDLRANIDHLFTALKKTSALVLYNMKKAKLKDSKDPLFLEPFKHVAKGGLLTENLFVMMDKLTQPALPKKTRNKNQDSIFTEFAKSGSFEKRGSFADARVRTFVLHLYDVVVMSELNENFQDYRDLERKLRIKLELQILKSSAEHVKPEVKARGKKDQAVRDSVFMLGNHILLDSSTNSKLQDDEFSEKKTAYDERRKSGMVVG